MDVFLWVYISDLVWKWQCRKIFYFRFFHFPNAPGYNISAISIFIDILEDTVCNSGCTTGVNDTVLVNKPPVSLTPMVHLEWEFIREFSWEKIQHDAYGKIRAWGKKICKKTWRDSSCDTVPWKCAVGLRFVQNAV